MTEEEKNEIYREKQKKFLDTLSEKQKLLLNIKNKFIISQNEQTKELQKKSDNNMHNFKKEDDSILYKPKTKEDKIKEKKEKIGKREFEAWPVDKVICIRFEVWGERKKLINKGQIIEHKKEEKSNFEKQFFGHSYYLSNKEIELKKGIKYIILYYGLIYTNV